MKLFHEVLSVFSFSMKFPDLSAELDPKQGICGSCSRSVTVSWEIVWNKGLNLEESLHVTLCSIRGIGGTWGGLPTIRGKEERLLLSLTFICCKFGHGQ